MHQHMTHNSTLTQAATTWTSRPSRRSAHRRALDQSLSLYAYIYIYTYIYTAIHTHIYIYIYTLYTYIAAELLTNIYSCFQCQMARQDMWFRPTHVYVCMLWCVFVQQSDALMDRTWLWLFMYLMDRCYTAHIRNYMYTMYVRTLTSLRVIKPSPPLVARPQDMRALMSGAHQG